MRFSLLWPLVFLSASGFAQPLAWQTLAPGITFSALSSSSYYHTSKLHVLRVDPKRYQFKLITAQTLQRKAGLVPSYAKHSQALIAVNGGFFDSDFQPLGLRITQGKRLNPIKNISWWGIFTLQDHKPKIIGLAAYQAEPADFAIQAGPRLLINGQIPKLQDKPNARSALCITKDKQIVIAVTEHLPLTLTQLATILRRPTQQGGLACQDALNLDGGHSSQLYINIGDTLINVPNLSPVADVIVVKPLT